MFPPKNTHTFDDVLNVDHDDDHAALRRHTHATADESVREVRRRGPRLGVLLVGWLASFLSGEGNRMKYATIITIISIIVTLTTAHSFGCSGHPSRRRVAFVRIEHSHYNCRTTEIRKRRINISRHTNWSPLFSIPFDDETGDKAIMSNLNTVINSRPQTTSITRRSAATLIIATAATAFASITMIDSAEAAATTIIDPLTDLSFGTASWNDPADASYASSSQQQSSSSATTAITTTSRPIPLNARIVPPSFATYLSRFLLHYDANAEKWWIAQTDLYSLLPVNEAKKKQSQTFGSYAYSIQRGLYTYISGKDGNNIQSYAMVRKQYAALLVALLDRYDDDKKTTSLSTSRT